VLIALVAEGGPSTALGTGSAGVLDDVAGFYDFSKSGDAIDYRYRDDHTASS
jgi:hypothetical protein